MQRIESSSARNIASTWCEAENAPQGLDFLSAAGRTSERSIWILAIASLVFAVVAANLLCLSPRWYSNRFIAYIYEPTRFVLLTAAVGGAAVQVFWELLNGLPSTGRMQIVRNLSGGWVFLPCVVLLYERNSPWILFAVALVAVGMAVGLKQIMPPPAETSARFYRPVAELQSLDGLPPADSPLMLAFWVAVFTQAAFCCALGGSLLLSAYALSISAFLIVWRWIGFDPHMVEWWTGKHPPLRQTAAAILLTAATLIPFSIGGKFGFLGLHGPVPKLAVKGPSAAAANSGFIGIILYPPPKKKEIIAPMPRTDPLRSGLLTKPLTIPFDGQYWYFKSPYRSPGIKAHIAHGTPTDANVNPRSTDLSPLQMEAHQILPEPINLACCSEINVTVTNADTRAGEISLHASFGSSTAPGQMLQSLGQQPLLSSQPDRVYADRAPVKETLRFQIPSPSSARSVDEISIQFMAARQRSRTGAKVSIDSFQIIPKP